MAGGPRSRRRGNEEHIHLQGKQSVPLDTHVPRFFLWLIKMHSTVSFCPRHLLPLSQNLHPFGDALRCSEVAMEATLKIIYVVGIMGLKSIRNILQHFSKTEEPPETSFK